MSSAKSHLSGVQLDETTCFGLGINTYILKKVSKIDIPTDFWPNGKEISEI